MSVMSADGKIYGPGGSWWSPYGDTDEEIQRNLKTGNMPNAPDAMRVGPEHFTGTAAGDDDLQDFLEKAGYLFDFLDAYLVTHGVVEPPDIVAEANEVLP